MPQKLAHKVSNKFIITVILALSVTVMGSTVVMWYLGSFTKPEVMKGNSEPFRVAYMLNIGPYNEIQGTLDKVAEHLRNAKIEPKTPFILILDESTVFESSRRSKVGYLISRRDYVPGPLETEVLPSREVLIAKYDGGAMMGSYKSYEAMRHWSKKYGYTLSLPALEIYHPDGIMEYHLGINKGSQ
ncbi:MAG: GyrI-like domain-containing protein [Mariprofundaceae bacterium]